MKIRTALISLTVSGALIAGGLYAAYYHFVAKSSPVEVVPVKNVDMSYWFSDGYYYDEDTIYGTITSRASQTVTLEDYSIEEIYVSEGDEVTEGTPLFSYDMTYQEIELESQQISLQSLELQLRKYQKELAQYTGTTATASLEAVTSVLTSSSADEIIDDDSQNGSAESTEGSSTESTGGGSGSGLEIEEIETVDPETDEEILRTSVVNYEALMTVLKDWFDEYEDELTTEDIGEELTAAVEFYRKNLADEEEEQLTNEEGETVTVSQYVLKDSVKEVLSSEEIKTLEACADLMDHYHAAYVDLMIREAQELTGEDLETAVKAAREEYENLSGDARENVTQLEELEILEEQLSGETESEPAQTDSESETEAASENENETETGGTIESEIQTETSGNTESETETETAGNTESETETSAGSESETESETESGTIEIASLINSFLLMADEILSETAAPEQGDYENAIAFYQMYLAVASDDIVNENTGALMEEYSLNDAVLTYLSELGSEGAALQTEITGTYRELCLAYVRSVVFALVPETMTREDLTAVQEIYDQLGTAWALLLGEEEPSVSDYLTAYDISLRFLELDEGAESFLEDLQNLYTDYLFLTDTQKELVWNAEELLLLADQYGLIETETETETEYYDWDYDDYYDYDSDLSAEEIEELVEELETSIKECELSIREAELGVEQAQRVVDKKVVKATVSGTVASIGNLDGSTSDDSDYFVRITSNAGLYAKGVISELNLKTISVGDVISGIDESGQSFTAVIKEISDYPADDWSDYVYTYTSNVSYYSFYALIDEPEDIEEGSAELTLSTAFAEDSDGIYLESYFVRTDGAGNNYVYVQGDDGTLELRYVTTGTSPDDYYVKIISGLSTSDLIAFPYGEDVYEGAATKEVDSLSYD